LESLTDTEPQVSSYWCLQTQCILLAYNVSSSKPNCWI